MIEDIIHNVLKSLFNAMLSSWHIWLMIGGFAIVGVVIKSRWFKGKAGEVLTCGMAKLMLPKEYTIINDIMLPRSDNPDLTTQIDHVIVSRYGLFVIETKNYQGKIYGSKDAKVWTYYPGGKKTSFQNPLRQNYLHTRTLADILEIPHEIVHSCIIFCGESSEIADNVGSVRKVMEYVKSFEEVIFSDQEVQTLVAEINEGKLPNTISSRKEHVRRLREA